MVEFDLPNDHVTNIRIEFVSMDISVAGSLSQLLQSWLRMRAAPLGDHPLIHRRSDSSILGLCYIFRIKIIYLEESRCWSRLSDPKVGVKGDHKMKPNAADGKEKRRTVGGPDFL